MLEVLSGEAVLVSRGLLAAICSSRHVICRWHFAYQCILEETVRRRHKMWSWENIKRHRELCRSYQSLYTKKLLEKKPTADLLADIEVTVSYFFLFTP